MVGKATNNFQIIQNYRGRTNVFANYKSLVSQSYKKVVQNPVVHTTKVLIFGKGG